jgi:tetratricopeptide (TPR) repeat protein
MNRNAFYEPLNPRLRLIMFGLCLVTLLGISIWFIPNAISLYYQTRGGLLLEQVYSTDGDLASGIACETPPLVHEGARSQVSMAIAALRKAIRYNESEAQSYLLLGRAYCLLGQTAKAINAYRSYVHLRPKNSLGRMELGFTYEASGNNELAIREWRSAGLTKRYFLDAGDQRRRAGYYEEALKWYYRADQFGGDEVDFYIYLTKGLFAERKSLWREAIQYYEQAIDKASQLDVPLSSVFHHLGRIQQDHLKDWDSALRLYDEAIEKNKFDSTWELSDTHLRRGGIIKYTDQKKEALREIELAVETYPHFYAMVELGRLYWEMEGNLDKAEETLKRAISIFPEEKLSYSTLGDIYWEADLSEKAVEYYTMALNLDPNDMEIIAKLNSLKER